MDIKRVIKANKLTVKEVAERMGITPIGLSQQETFTFDSEKALIDYAEGLKVNK